MGALTQLLRVAVATLLLLPHGTTAQEYRFVPSEANLLTLEVSKTGLLSSRKHQFEFRDLSGTLRFNASRPAQSYVQLSIKTGSLVCRDEWVSNGDRNKIERYARQKMLDSGHYPDITFESNAMQPIGSNSFVVSGTLTIRGRAAPAQVNVAFSPLSNGVLRFQGSSAIKLSDYGLKPPTAALGAVGTNNEMRLSFHLSSALPASAESRAQHLLNHNLALFCTIVPRNNGLPLKTGQTRFQ